MAHPAGAHIGAGVVENPMTFGRWQPALPFGGRSLREVAKSVIACVVRLGGEIAARELNPERSMCIGAGQGRGLQGTDSPLPATPG